MGSAPFLPFSTRPGVAPAESSVYPGDLYSRISSGFPSSAFFSLGPGSQLRVGLFPPLSPSLDSFLAFVAPAVHGPYSAFPLKPETPLPGASTWIGWCSRSLLGRATLRGRSLLQAPVSQVGAGPTSPLASPFSFFTPGGCPLFLPGLPLSLLPYFF